MSEKTNSWKTSVKGGEYRRKDSQFRHWISTDGSGDFAAEANRYHLYVSLACPWAHRALIFRKLKELESLIDVSVVHPDLLENGWSFDTDYPGTTGDKLYGVSHLKELYYKADPHYDGNFTVPMLWDKKTQTIVNNESAEIIRMFNSAFDGITGNTLDYYPKSLREDIDTINQRVYHDINNGVYKTGFATSQAAYEKHFDALFAALDEIEQRLGQQRYLVGAHITEADWRLFTTLVRFDAVYVGHFKCNLRRIADYPNLSNYLRDLYQQPGIAETTDIPFIQRHYYFSHKHINANQVVPKGPELHLDAPHDRGRLSA
ncbi:glutathione S-transferase, C-terminal domain protein [gamma proteobacterium HTCC5015]|nr:glutathione S-transferase, C-terminal domain protein [gamma proteobacterium HTCC5015]